MKIVRFGMGCGAGFAFLGWERFGPVRDDVHRGIIGFLFGSAPLGWKGTRGLEAIEWSDPRGLIQIQTDEPEHGVNPA